VTVQRRFVIPRGTAWPPRRGIRSGPTPPVPMWTEFPGQNGACHAKRPHAPVPLG
jgi:hypothetical protein